MPALFRRRSPLEGQARPLFSRENVPQYNQDDTQDKQAEEKLGKHMYAVPDVPVRRLVGTAVGTRLGQLCNFSPALAANGHGSVSVKFSAAPSKPRQLAPSLTIRVC